MNRHFAFFRNTILIGILCLLTAPVFGQSDTMTRLSNYAGNVNQFDTINPQEKVYLHFDNTGYYVGDTIWFKAYTVLARNLSFTSLSRVLRVELLTPYGEVIAEKCLYIREGQCYGEFALLPRYESGFYEVRAYTRAMLNWGEECVFSRVFPVYDMLDKPGRYGQRKMHPYSVSDKRYKRYKVEKRQKVNLSFYPEGGHAIVGMLSRIAFKATGPAGENMNVSGKLYDSDGKQVAVLNTYHQGMGHFELVTNPETYMAEVLCEGKTYRIPVTWPTLPSGYVLCVDNSDRERLVIGLSKSESIPSDTIAVCVSCRGKVCSATMVMGFPYTFQLSKLELPAGCLQITAYNSNGDILADRLAFNSTMKQRVKVEVRSDKEEYKAFEKVNLEIRLSDASGNPVESCFSLSVCDAATRICTGYEENILTDLLLSSDVEGYIEHPMQYFEQPDSLTLAKLDLLMMVQGWRRYDWRLMADVVEFSPLHYAEKGLQAFGKVVSLVWKKPLPHARVKMWTYDRKGRHLLGKTITDKEGRFYFTFTDSIYPVDKWTMGIEVTDKRGSRLASRVMLDRQFSPKGRSYEWHDMQVRENLFDRDVVSNFSINEMQVLDEVLVNDRDKSKAPSPDVVIDVEKMVSDLQDQDENYPESIDEFLTWYVPGYNPYQSRTYKNLPITILVQYPDGREYKRSLWEKSLSSDFVYEKELLSPEKVSHVEIYYKDSFAWRKLRNRKRKKYANGPSYPSALARIVVYDDSFHGKYKKGIRHTVYYCYSQVKEFYHLDHRNAILGDMDYRRTLYWNPEVKTDSTGKASIRFYNNSTCRQMHVSAEGLGQDGGFVAFEHFVSLR